MTTYAVVHPATGQGYFMLNLGSRLPYPPPKEHALDSMGGHTKRKVFWYKAQGLLVGGRAVGIQNLNVLRA